MIGPRITPSRAFALICMEVVDAERSVRRRSESLDACSRHVIGQLDVGSSPNSLGEVQNKGAMLDAAIGTLCAVRDAALLAAAAVIDDDRMLLLSADDWDMVHDATSRSPWLARHLSPWMPDRPDRDECPAAGIARPS